MGKTKLRSKMNKKLLSLSDLEIREMSKRSCDALIASDAYNEALVVMFYLSLPHEVATSRVILDAWQKGKTVAVPKVSWQQRNMIAVEISSLDTEISVSHSGFQNPITGIPVPIGDIDLVVSPGLAFDRDGGRLGRGGAYYDRFLSSDKFKAIKCGLAFDLQLVDTVPVEEHDIKMDYIVTESGCVSC